MKITTRSIISIVAGVAAIAGFNVATFFGHCVFRPIVNADSGRR